MTFGVDFFGILLGFKWVRLRLTRVLLGWPGSTGFYWVFLCCTGFDLVLVVQSGFLLSFT